LLLKFYTRAGRFPRGRGELPDEAVEFVARQVGVDPAELGFYEWTGRTIEYHRAQIRAHLGFRECSVADADKLTEWLAANVCEAERRPELVRDELLMRCRAERIEPPATGRVDRVVRSALHQADQTLTARIVARLPVDAAGRLRALVAVDVPDEESVLALIKSVRDLVRDLAFVHDLSRDLALELGRTLAHALDRDHVLDRALDRDLDRIHYLARDLARDLDRVRHDFTEADLRGTDLSQVALDGLRWSAATRWPSVAWHARVSRNSVEIAPGIFEVRSGPMQVSTDVLVP
jgi:hypothetical protein